MNLTEMRKQVEEMPLVQRGEYRRVLSLVGIGGRVWPCLEGHLDQAQDIKGFLESVYEDDACRWEAVWALWAKMDRKRWPSRFDFTQAVRGVLVNNKGVVLDFGGAQVLVPVTGRGRTVDVFVFSEDGFNSDAADYYGSISGSFSCCGMELEGTFDIYRSERAVILERWAFDKLGRRESKKRRCRKSECSCCS